MTTGTQSIAEVRTMALAMFADNVPCFFQTADPSCEKPATWVAYFAHEENATECTSDTALPLCSEHKAAMLRSTSPFWRMWFQVQTLPCEDCGAPLRLDRFEAI